MLLISAAVLIVVLFTACTLEETRVYKKQYFTITYNANDGVGSISSESVKEGQSTIVSDGAEMSRRGYTFLYWTTEKDGGGDRYESWDKIIIQDNVNLYAQWQKMDRRTIRYYGGDYTAGEEPSNQKVDVWTKAIVKDIGTMEKEGYYFLEWNTEEDGSGETYLPDSFISVGEKDIALYAIWEVKEKCTLSYDSRFSSISVPASSELLQRDTVTVPAVSGMEKDGYVFEGWTTDSDGLGTAYREGDTFIINSDTVLYAKWRPSFLLFEFYSWKNAYIVSGINDGANVSDIVIPGEYDGYTILWIYSKVFKDRTEIRSVSIPGTVTSLESSTFSGCSALKSITMAEGVTSVGEEAFYSCSALTSVTIPESVTWIGGDAFTGCSSLSEIIYNGTKEEWSQVKKESNWCSGGIIVRCSDGNVTV